MAKMKFTVYKEYAGEPYEDRKFSSFNAATRRAQALSTKQHDPVFVSVDKDEEGYEVYHTLIVYQNGKTGWQDKKLIKRYAGRNPGKNPGSKSVSAKDVLKGKY